MFESLRFSLLDIYQNVELLDHMVMGSSFKEEKYPKNLCVRVQDLNACSVPPFSSSSPHASVVTGMVGKGDLVPG